MKEQNWDKLLKAEEPWTRYRVMKDLEKRDRSDPELLAARKKMLEHPLIEELMEKTFPWFIQNGGRHNDAKLPHYNLAALAELGVTAGDRGMDALLAEVVAHSEDGLPAIAQDLPEKGSAEGRRDKLNWHALPCDVPVLLYSLKLMGSTHPLVEEGIQKVREKWAAEDPWFCHFFFVESMFKKTGADCPVAGLMALKMGLEGEAAEKAFRSLEAHRALKRSLYYFGRSKKFWTFKFPFVWYNALYMADALSLYPQFHESELYRELLEWILQNKTEEGLWKANSIFMPYKGWDFGQKKTPSSWISFLCCRILDRTYNADRR